ncbi:helix-turn-helix transcriptional regulator [Coraliomargarita sp. SDUM461004]|uniref:Helix-turn-helix transcriptional regulator n=1 Tax=Thalassobacterium sedimentorum TaxID=3041258 RepID=A0ABU1ARW1_9BACT|nr:helix-turn-helix transcriptional regulator [Coraliomargarita sp. SDUM461004]MDQ8196343.1 helix-turn-helix transcriptional regulator [Coraliomargarita sp. SDUM461004]
MKQIFALLKHLMKCPDLFDSSIEIVSPPFVHESVGEWNWQTNGEQHWNLWVCLEGKAVIECDGVEYPVQPWTAFLFSAGSKLVGRSLAVAKSIRNFSIHISLGAENARLLKGRLLGIELHEPNNVNSLINLAIRLSAYPDSFAQQQLQSLTLSMIGILWRESIQPVQTDAAWLIYRQLDRIHAGQDMFRTVDELASEVNLSRIHYGRCFRQLTNESPNRYLILKRVERACVLLTQTNWGIDAVARSIGYNDIYFFSRQFRRVKGCSPSQYRDAAGK